MEQNDKTQKDSLMLLISGNYNFIELYIMLSFGFLCLPSHTHTDTPNTWQKYLKCQKVKCGVITSAMKIHLSEKETHTHANTKEQI